MAIARSDRTAFAEKQAAALVKEVPRPPVDLFKLAARRHVVRIHLKEILPDGATQTATGGFHVFVRDSRNVEVDPALRASTAPSLTPRQRFTLAHELAHTFYYDIEPDVPRPLPRMPQPDLLERSCDRAASILLLPPSFFKSDLAQEPITLRRLFDLSKQYQASFKAIVGRARQLYQPSSEDRAIISFRSKDGLIEDAFVPPRFLEFLPRPRPYRTTISAWCGSLVEQAFWGAAASRFVAGVRGGTLEFRKTGQRNGRGFYVEIAQFSR